MPSAALAYLLLMTFGSGQFSTFDAAKMQAVNASPYKGVVVPLVSQYDASNHTFAEFQPDLQRMKQTSTKDIWPMVSLNRIVGCTQCPPQASAKFRSINGIEFSSQTDALSSFNQDFRIALKIARSLHSPGIVIDPEPYNDEAMTVQKAARLRHDQPEDIRKNLMAVGAGMASIAQQEYPNAVILFFYTALSQLNKPSAAQNIAAFVTLGLLRASATNGGTLKVVSGGEDFGFCFSSLERLREITAQRKEEIGKFTSEFPNLSLGATIAPWNDPASRRDWMVRQQGQLAECGKAGNLHGPDFIPLLHYMLQTYPYVWVYAAGAADYRPFGQNAPIFNRIISSAVAGSAR
jgi:hypothetical protein